MSYIKIAAISPDISIANPEKNVRYMLKLLEEIKDEAEIFVFPELSVTGYTCADLFNQSALIIKALEEIKYLAKATKDYKNKLIVVGAPVRKDNQLFNCAVYIYNGEIIAIVPKTYIPTYNEFYELRWFSSSKARLSDSILIDDKDIPFSPYIIVRMGDAQIGTDVCEDLWMSIPPSSYHTLYGANIILNLSASNELISKAEYRKNLVAMQSAKCICGYVYVSAGNDESTTDVVFSGHKIIASNGTIQEESKYDKSVIISTIDIEKLENDRARFNTFMGDVPEKKYIYVDINRGDELCDVVEADPYPFVPKDEEKRHKRCEEIFDIQSLGLAQRMKKSGIEKLVIGISGGLDSTLALLVAVRAVERLGYPTKNIIGITMPGFGTTKRTKNNSVELMKELKITTKEVSIVDGAMQNFKDIGHDPSVYDVTYENVQARMRTMILMNTANHEGALVVGTGDLSELALGWCTYNGDHMSMYGVNVSIPKTLVKYLIESIAKDYESVNLNVSAILRDICDTPISPELLPTDKDGNMVQKTEDTIGKYDLHDFFLYNMLRNGFGPSKIYKLACVAFADVDKKQILDTLKIFYKRFFTQQFKRSCLPDGPKVGSVAVSPRGDLRMPSDASFDLWLKEIEEITVQN